VRKQWALLVFGILIVAGLALSFLVISRNPVRSRFGKIQLGMARTESERILGGSAGDYTTVPRAYLPKNQVRAGECSATPLEELPDWWWFDEGLIILAFDEADTVAYKVFVPALQPTIADCVEAWIENCRQRAQKLVSD
jgi:hypothetical protein